MRTHNWTDALQKTATLLSRSLRAGEFAADAGGMEPDDSQYSGWGRMNVSGSAIEEDPALYGADSIVVYSRSDLLNRRLVAALRQHPLLPASPYRVRTEGLFTLIWLRSHTASTQGEPGLWEGTVQTMWEGESGLGEIQIVNGDGRPNGFRFRANGTEPGDFQPRFNSEDEGALPEWETDQDEMNAGCALFLLPAAPSLEAEDAHAYARLRNGNAPLIPVVCCESIRSRRSTETAALLADIRRYWGAQPVAITLPALATSDRGDRRVLVADDEDGLSELMSRILSLCPHLAPGLGREAPAYRRVVANDIIRSSTWTAGVLGLEPAPLLDIPIQLFVLRRLANRLAAIYGRPGPAFYDKGGISIVTLGLGVRMTVQQAAKLTPVVGWGVSALLSAASAWLLGQTLVRQYEDEPMPGVDLLTIVRDEGGQWLQWAGDRLQRLGRRVWKKLMAIRHQLENSGG